MMLFRVPCEFAGGKGGGGKWRACCEWLKLHFRAWQVFTNIIMCFIAANAPSSSHSASRNSLTPTFAIRSAADLFVFSIVGASRVQAECAS